MLLFCKSKDRPVTIGELAVGLHLPMPLEQVEGALEEMVVDKLLVRVTTEDSLVLRYDRCI